MTQEGLPSAFRSMLDAGMLVSSIMAVIWLFRTRSKGATAYLMSSAFIVFASLLYAFREDWSLNARIALGVLLALLLGADVAVRAVRQKPKGDPP